MLVKVDGTPFEDEKDLDPFEFIRTIAVARIMMPESHVRLSAGRESMNDELQALAFLAGANSIFYCDSLLTTANPKANQDMALLNRLNIVPEKNKINIDPSDQEEILHKKILSAKTDHLFYNAVN